MLTDNEDKTDCVKVCSDNARRLALKPYPSHLSHLRPSDLSGLAGQDLDAFDFKEAVGSNIAGIGARVCEQKEICGEDGQPKRKAKAKAKAKGKKKKWGKKGKTASRSKSDDGVALSDP